MMSIEKLNSAREFRGLAILSTGDAITQNAKNSWTVRSQTGVGEYEVRLMGDRRTYRCTCPDFQNRQLDCKHIFALKFSLKLKANVETDAEAEIPDKVDFRPANCPQCGEEGIIKSGKRRTGRGRVQRYKCLSCGHRFAVDKGFSRMKHDPKAITIAMDLYFKGNSLRKICDHLKQFYNLEVCQTTPMRWIKKYIKLLAGYSEKYKAEVGNIWHSDEMTAPIREKGEKGYYEWIWNLMDAETRFLLACRISKTREKADARKPLKDAKAKAKSRPDAIVTDGLQSYREAVKKEFYDKNAQVKNPPFRYDNFQSKRNNNIVERLNGTVRERLKVMRGLDSSETAPDFAEGMAVYYNYIRPHQAIGGLTPAEMAHIPIDLSGNRWLTMIELTAMQKKSRNATVNN